MKRKNEGPEISDSDNELADIVIDSVSESSGSDVESLEDYEEKFLVYRKKQLPPIDPDYNSDSSDEETNNTIGNVPIEWYDDYPHIGYCVNGEKIMKPAKGDDLDKLISLMDDKNAWKTVHDKLEGKDIVLSKTELEMLKRIQKHQFPDSQYDPYEPTIEWFTSKTEIMPISSAPEPKRRFIPSKNEASKIMKIARAIRAGLIVPASKRVAKPKKGIYDMWESTDSTQRPNHIEAPKMALPEHIESYNPPAEYILSKEEDEQWRAMDPEDRPYNFFPHKYNALRNVPGYNRFIQERFERCLDLYLCPRTIKQKLNIDPESLIPKLPSPRDLQPFPTKLSITYKGHVARVRTFAVHPSGHWLASGSDDQTVKVWEVTTGRALKTFAFSGNILSVAWNPNPQMCLLAVVWYLSLTQQ
jgi:ribosome biogenesis protein ERB1